MSRERTNERKIGISGRLREGFEGSLRSLSKIEAQGEHVLKGLAGVMEKHGIDASTKAIEDLGRDARTFLNQLNESIEEGAEKVLQRLNVPTKEDLDAYNQRMRALIEENVKSRLEKLKVPTRKDLDFMARQLRGNLEEQVRKGVGRLNLASRKDVEAVAGDLKKLREEVGRLNRAGSSKGAKAAPKTAAPKPAKAPAARKTAKKKA